MFWKTAMIKKKAFIKIIWSNLTTDPWEVHVVQYGHTRPWPVEIAQGVPGFWSNKNDQMGLKIKIPGARITQTESEVKPLWFLRNFRYINWYLYDEEIYNFTNSSQ